LTFGHHLVGGPVTLIVRARAQDMPTLGVFASIFDPGRRILLVHQTYADRQWTTPGGRVECGESPIVALEREAREEISCEIEVISLIGVYAKPYKDDIVLSLLALVASGVPCPDGGEISDVGFFAQEALPHEMAQNTRSRVLDAFENRHSVCRIFEDAQSEGFICAPSAP
jgi:8-oxo-dGTP diphosphatase